MSKRQIKFNVETVNDPNLKYLPFAIGEMIPKATDGYIKSRKGFGYFYMIKDNRFQATVMHDGVKYDFYATPEDVFASPIKENCVLEIGICIFMMILFLVFLPPGYLTEGRTIIGIIIAAVFGKLAGQLRIGKQQVLADIFNESET